VGEGHGEVGEQERKGMVRGGREAPG